MTVLTFYLEGIQDAVADLCRVAQLEVVTLFLFIGFLIFQEIALEGSHLRLIEEWGILAAPEIEEIIACVIARIIVGVVLEGSTYHHADVVHQVFSAVFGIGIDLNLLQGAVLIQRTAGVEEEVRVADGVHATV